MARSIKARMFYKSLHGKLETFLDIIPAHEIVNTMNEGSSVIIGITWQLSNIVRQLMKVLLFFFYIKVAMGWMNYTLALVYCLIYYISIKI